MTNISFADFGLAAPLLDALAAAGFETPTPIQAQAIRPQLEGRDILGIAQTGTGKTAAFGLPLLHHLRALEGRPAPRSARALILAPTRELAVQIDETLRRLSGGGRLSTVLVLGGASRSAQVRKLQRGVDVVVATPGRLTDLVAEGHLKLEEIRWVVLDEADRMLDMGFVKDVTKIVRALHPRRQSALFSATMPPEVEKLANGLLSDPVRVEVSPQGRPAGRVLQSVEVMPAGEKRGRLAAILSERDVELALVFARTKRGADRVAENLGKDGVPAEALHGNKSQNARQRALQAFKTGRIRVLVATDIAARGIDVTGITHVVNYEMPDEPESYVHRIGRTARNGADGVAVSLCSPEERDKLRAIERLTKRELAPAGAFPRQETKRRPAPKGRPDQKSAQAKQGGEAASEARPRRRRNRGPRRAAA